MQPMGTIRGFITCGACNFSYFYVSHNQNLSVKKHFLLVWAIVAAMLLGSMSGFAQQRIVGDVLVMLKHGHAMQTTLKDVRARFPQAEVTVGETVAPTLNIWLFKANPAWEQQVLEYLLGLPQVQLAQFNRIAEERLTPNDTIYPNQWNFENTGQGSGVPGADIKASLAWDITTGGYTATGDTIVVAVIDQGMELAHSDLNFWKNGYEIPGDSIDNDGNGYIDDVNGWHVLNENDIIPNGSHGTLCAGLVGAKTNNLIGTAGVNWGLPIMPVICQSYTESQVVAAYAYILETRRLYNITNGARGAFVVATSSSFGIDFGFAADYPIWCAMYDSLGMQGIMSVGATANINLDVEVGGDIPSTCTSDFLIVVTNTTRTDFKNPGSGYGPTSVDLGAPGTGIWSTTSGNGHSASTGTSFATPQVAGAVALLFSTACPEFMVAYKQQPDSMLRLVRNSILASVDVVPDLAASTASGGRLNLYEALLRFQNDICVTCLAINATKQNVLCNGDTTGAISLTIDVGRAPFVYTWSNGDSVAFAQNLTAGQYSVVVTDSLGCSRIGYYTITEPSLLQTGFIVNRSTGVPNGSITVLVQGGEPPYSYVWQNNVGTGNLADSLLPGTYALTTTDANGCMQLDTVTVYLDSSVNTIEADDIISQISFFPNPANGFVQYEIATNGTAEISLSLMDIVGKLVLEKSLGTVTSATNGSIDMEGLNTGIYFMQVSVNGRFSSVYKIVKQ